MFCLNCGEKIGEYDTFCSYCGAKQISNVEKSNDYNGWFYIAGNHKRGPFSLDEMAAAIDDEIVKRDTFVWHGGMSQWVLAEQTALKAYLKHVVPPLPDEIVDNKFVWMLATIPILVSWALLFVVSDFKWITITMVVLNVSISFPRYIQFTEIRKRTCKVVVVRICFSSNILVFPSGENRSELCIWDYLVRIVCI